MAKKKYRLLPRAAQHQAGNLEDGFTTHSRGEIVESDKPLDKLFVNKFEEVQGKQEAAPEEGNTLNGPRTSKAVDPKDDTPSPGSEYKKSEATKVERDKALAEAAGGEEEETPKPKRKPAAKKAAPKEEEEDDEEEDTEDEDSEDEEDEDEDEDEDDEPTPPKRPAPKKPAARPAKRRGR